MLKITKVTLSNGTDFAPAALTVIIGPNNGGKSRFLKDIQAKLTAPRVPTPSLSQVNIEALPNWFSALDKLAAPASLDANGYLILDQLGVALTAPEQKRYPQNQLQVFRVPSSQFENVEMQYNALEMFGALFLASLGTEGRLSLVARQTNATANISGPGSVAEALKTATTDVIEWIDTQVRGAFGSDLIVDNSQSFQVGMVLGDAEQLPTHYRDRETTLRTLPRVEEQGDGVRAFCGIVAAIATTDRSVVLIDEPEAFLHPPQALLMGRALARVPSRGAQVFVATHSAEVLRGVIGETADVQILRLSQSSAGFEARLIAADELRKISSDPLLSSARVLDGLFYRGVVIAEADGDVAIYRRVLEDEDGSGAVHFLNSYGKSATISMTAPYRAMGIGHAVIVDFDILRDPNEFQRLVEALGGPWAALADDYAALLDEIEIADHPDQRVEDARQALASAASALNAEGDARSKLKRAVAQARAVRERASIWSVLKKKGIKDLSKQAKTLFGRIDTQCSAVGLFIVPCGEREAWLPGIVEYRRDKKAWTEAALHALSAGKVEHDHPLRQFMRNVRAHVLA